jgi:hypothetical protein
MRSVSFVSRKRKERRENAPPIRTLPHRLDPVLPIPPVAKIVHLERLDVLFKLLLGILDVLERSRVEVERERDGRRAGAGAALLVGGGLGGEELAGQEVVQAGSGGSCENKVKRKGRKKVSIFEGRGDGERTITDRR